MSEQDVKEVVEEAIDKGAETAKQATKLIPLIANVGSGMIALATAVVAGNLALGKFRAAYETGKKVSP